MLWHALQSWPLGARHLEFASEAAWSSKSDTYGVVLHDTATRSRKAVFWTAQHAASLRDAPRSCPLVLHQSTTILANYITPDPLDKHDFVLALSDGNILLLCSADGAVTKLEGPVATPALHSSLHAGVLYLVGHKASANGVHTNRSIPMHLRAVPLVVESDAAAFSADLPLPEGAQKLQAFASAAGWAACIWDNGAVTLSSLRSPTSPLPQRSSTLTFPHLLATSCTHRNSASKAAAPGQKRSHSANGMSEGALVCTPSDTFAPLCVCAVTAGQSAVAVLSLHTQKLRYVVLNAVLGTVQAAGSFDVDCLPALDGPPTLLATAASWVCDSGTCQLAAAVNGNVMQVQVPSAAASLAAAVGSLDPASRNPAAAAAQATLAPQTLAHGLSAPFVCAVRGGYDTACSPPDCPTPGRAAPLMRTCSPWKGLAAASNGAEALAPHLIALAEGSSPSKLAQAAVGLEGCLQRMRPRSVLLTGGLAERAAGHLARCHLWPLLSRLLKVNPLLSLAQCPDILQACVDAEQFKLLTQLLSDAEEVCRPDFGAALGMLLQPTGCAARREALVKGQEALRKEAVQRCDSVKGAQNRGPAWRAAAYSVTAFDGFSMWQVPLHALVAFPQDSMAVAEVCDGLSSTSAVRLARYLVRWLHKHLDQVGLLPSLDSHWCVSSNKKCAMRCMLGAPPAVTDLTVQAGSTCPGRQVLTRCMAPML
jgi:hypothetical protein